MTASPPFPYAGETAAIASSLLWATAGIVFRRLKGRAPPAALNLGKNATATLCFAAAFLVVEGRPWPAGLSTDALLLLAASGLLGLSLCDTLLLRAMLEIGPRRATLLMCLNPVLVFLVALLPPWNQAAAASNPLRWAGLAVALAGVSLAALDAPDGTPDDRAARRRGVVDGLLAAVLNAAGVLLARLAIDRGAAAPAAAYARLAFGCAGLLVGGAILGRASSWVGSLARGGTWIPLSIAAFFGTFLGIGLNQAGLQWSASSGVATTLNSLSPVWLIPLSSWFLSERHTRRAWLSTLLALAGVALLVL